MLPIGKAAALKGSPGAPPQALIESAPLALSRATTEQRSTFARMRLLYFRRRDRNGVLARLYVAPGLIGIHLGELGAEKQDLRRIINPKQQRDERAGGAIG